MGRELISKGVSLTVPLRDGRRVQLTPDDQPIPEFQVDESLIGLLDRGDAYVIQYFELRENGEEEVVPAPPAVETVTESTLNGSETNPTSDSGDGTENQPETAPGSGDSEPGSVDPPVDGDGQTIPQDPAETKPDGEETEPEETNTVEVDWDAVESLTAKDLIDQLKQLKLADDPESLAIFDAIIAWETAKGDDARKTVLALAE